MITTASHSVSQRRGNRPPGRRDSRTSINERRRPFPARRGHAQRPRERRLRDHHQERHVPRLDRCVCRERNGRSQDGGATSAVVEQSSPSRMLVRGGWFLSCRSVAGFQRWLEQFLDFAIKWVLQDRRNARDRARRVRSAGRARALTMECRCEGGWACEDCDGEPYGHGCGSAGIPCENPECNLSIKKTGLICPRCMRSFGSRLQAGTPEGRNHDRRRQPTHVAAHGYQPNDRDGV